MARHKIRLADNVARVIFVETDATVGATLGTNLFTPDGKVATPTTVAAWLGGTGLASAQGPQQAHSLLTGLTAGNDHPQYILRTTLTTNGDLLVRSAGAVTRLPIGAEGQVLTVVSGLPTWVEAIAGSGNFTEGLFPPAYPESGWFWWDTYFDALYVYTENGWYDVSTGAPAPLNGLPVGGTAGQVLAKIDATNYNAQWVDASTGGGDGSEDYTTAVIAATDFDQGLSSSSDNTHPFRVWLVTGTFTMQNAAGSPGMVRLTKGPGTQEANAGGTYPLFCWGAGPISCEFRIYCSLLPPNDSTLNAFTVEFALTTATTGRLGSSAGVYAYGTTGTNGDQFRIRSRDGTTATETGDLFQWSATNWYKIRLEVNADGTEVEAFVDDVSIGTKTTNLPAANTMVRPRAHIASIVGYTSAQSTQLEVDYIKCKQVFTNPR